MTDTNLEQLIALKVPHSAMCAAIVTAHPRGGGFDRARLLAIAHHHGGGQLLAEALELRLGLIGLLYQADPTVLRPGSIRTEDMAQALAELPLSVQGGVIDFDGDALANRLRMASEAHGRA